MNTPAYFVFNVTAIHDPQGMLPYQAAVLETISAHHGSVLVGGGAVDSVEGESVGKYFIVRFDSMAAARAWYVSPAYQHIIGHRHASASCQAVLLAGLPA